MMKTLATVVIVILTSLISHQALGQTKMYEVLAFYQGYPMSISYALTDRGFWRDQSLAKSGETLEDLLNDLHPGLTKGYGKEMAVLVDREHDELIFWVKPDGQNKQIIKLKGISQLFPAAPVTNGKLSKSAGDPTEKKSTLWKQALKIGIEFAEHLGIELGVRVVLGGH